jgi:putative SOS response-associated peptidase YedK
MCGRYVLKTPSEEMRRAFDFVEHPNLAPRYNVAPTQEAPVIRQRRTPAGERTLQNLRWGLVPAWAEDPRIGARLINARSETLLEKPSFRTAFRRRRCLVPADGFYEWQAEGRVRQPFLITRRDDAVFAFAGLWERWTPPDRAAPLDSFTIITTTANDFLKPLHERMPVILPPDAYARWLDPDAEPEQLVELLKPAANDVLRCVPVDARVNSPRADDAELLVPIGPERRGE